MGTMLRQETQIQPSNNINDKLPLAQALRDASDSVEYDLNALRSIVNVVKDGTQQGNYFDPLTVLADGTTRGLKQLGTRQVAIETKAIINDVVVSADITVPAGANYVILSVGNTQAPAAPIAIGAATFGAVVAQSTNSGAQFAANELAQVAGADSFSPKNLCIIRRGGDGEVLEAVSQNNADVYALIQVEAGATDGGAFNDTSGGARVKLSFVIRDFVTKTYKPAPVADVAGQVINYTFGLRNSLFAMPETAWNGRGVYRQAVGQVDITLAKATANQAGAPIPVAAPVLWQLANNIAFKVQATGGGTDYFAITPSAGGVAGVLNTSTFAVTTTSPVPFSQGITANAAGGAVNVGVTAGQIDAAGLVVASTGTNPLLLKSQAQVAFRDGFLGQSTWASPQVNLAASAGDYTALKTAFGEVSIAQMLLKASQNSNHKVAWADVVGTRIAPGTNVTGAGSNANLNLQMPAYDMVTDPTQSVEVWLNGDLLRPGASASANCDWYPGDDKSKGDIKLTRPLYGLAGHADCVTVKVVGL